MDVTPAGFSLSITLDPPTATVVARGELDIFTAREVSRSLGEAVRSGCRTVVVDVGDVSFCDGSALGVLDRTRRDLVAQEGSLGFVGASPAFRRLCQMAGLDTVFATN